MLKRFVFICVFLLSVIGAFSATNSCAMPQNLAFYNITQESARLTWQMDGDNGTVSEKFIIVVRAVKDGKEVVRDTINSVDWEFEIGGLKANSDYEVILKADCNASAQGYSQEVKTVLSTLCSKQRLSSAYTFSFDGWTSVPECWFGSSEGVILQEAMKVGSSGGSVKLTSSGMSDAYIISRQFNHAANQMEVQFSVYGAKGTKYRVLLTPDPYDLSQAINPWNRDFEVNRDNEWHTVTFNTIVSDVTTKGMSVVVFMSSGVDATMYIDNFRVANAPKCPKVENLREIISDSTSTEIDWDEFVESDKYMVQLYNKTTKVTNYTMVKSHPCRLTGLDKNTAYEIKVRAYCSDSDSADYSLPTTIQTTCETRSETVFFEDFESGVFPPECWFTRRIYTPVPFDTYDPKETTWRRGDASLYAEMHSGKYCAEWQAAGTGTRTILVTQPIAIDVPYHYDLSLWIYRDKVYGYSAKEGEGLNILVNTRPDTIGATKLGFVSSLYTLYPVEKAPGYYQYEYNIPIAGSVYIIFEGVSKNSYDMFIDDIEVKLAPLCRKVSDVVIADVTTNSVKLTWEAGLRETQWSVKYTLVSGQHEITDSVSVVNNSELTIDNLVAGSQYTLYAEVRSDCGSGDVSEPVELIEKFETDCDAIATFPYLQTFDGDKFPPHCWSQYQSQPYGNPNDQFASDYKDEAWVRHNDMYWGLEFIKSGDASAKLQASSAGIRSALVSPQFTFEAGKEYVVSFWMYRVEKANESTSTVDNEGLNVLLSDVPNVVGAQNLGYVNVGSLFAPIVTEDGFYQYEFNIRASGNKYIIFEGQHQGTTDMYIDNVVIREKTNCGFVDVKIDSIKTTLARVTLLDKLVEEWQVSVGLPGFNPNSGAKFDAEGESVIISGLESQTDYELYARAKCDDGSYGPWSEFVYRFATQCEPLVVDYDNPYFDSFENCIVDEPILGCYQQLSYAYRPVLFEAKTGAYSDEGVMTLKPYEGSNFAVLPYNNDTWLLRPFQLKANSNYEVSLMARQDCDFGMNLNLAYFIEPDTSMVVDTMLTRELGSKWQEYKGWINVPADGVYYIGVNITTWGISFQQNNSVIDNFTVKEIECAPPVQIIESKVTPNAVEIDFYSIANAWEVKVASVDFDPEYGIADIATDTIRQMHYVFNGLQNNTEYFYSIRSLCAEPSQWSHVKSFRTICSKFELPYYENFEDPEFSNILCWTPILTNSYTSKSEVSATETYEGGVAYKLYESMTILPEFNVATLSNYLIRGYVYSSKSNAHVSIGVVKDITNPQETFEPVADVIVNNSYEWTEFVAYFSDLAKPDYAEFRDAKYIAIVVTNGTEFYLDNLEVIEIPTCLSPTEVVVENPTISTCQIRWYENGNATQWQVNGYYKNELVIDTVVTSNPATIAGLMAASTYDFKIRAICSDVDSSWWSSAGNITTECSSYTLPYDQSFTGLEAPKCWKQGLAYPNTIGNYWIHDNGAYVYKQYHNEDENVFPKGYTSMIVSPQVNLVGVENAMLSFDMYNYRTDSVQVLLSDDGGVTFDVVLGEGYVVMKDTTTLYFDLSEYIGKTICIGINAKSFGIKDSYLYLDNFSIEEMKSCLRPLSVELIIAYDTFAKMQLNDTSNNSSSWQYVVGSAGFNPDTAVVVTFTKTEFNITGLAPLSNYEVYVRSVCSSDAYSDWRGPITIQTACSMGATFPYREGFEGITSLENNCFKIFSFKAAEERYPFAEINTKSYVTEGAQAIRLSSSMQRCLYIALPLFGTPLKDLKISLDYSTEYDEKYPTIATPLEIGVMADLNVEKSYTKLVQLPYSISNASYSYAFKDADSKIDLTDKYIVIKYEKTPPRTDGLTAMVWAGIDNIMVVPIDYCYTIDSLRIVDFTETSVKVTWTSFNSSVEKYDYQLMIGDNVVRESSVTADSLLFTGLIAATDYRLRIRANCAAENYSDWATIDFRTLSYPPTLPYSCGFEDEESNNWVLADDGQKNHFIIGEDKLGVKSGGKSLYISDDSYNTYAIGATSSSYAYRAFEFAPGQYKISYSWKCKGEHTDDYTADYARIYFAPVDKEIKAGKRISNYVGNNADCIMLDAGKGLCMSPRWNEVSVNVVFLDTVKYNLVIEWYNNAGGGEQTPFAIDDISIEKVECPMLEKVELRYVEDTKAVIDIYPIIDADSYQYRVCLTDDYDNYILLGSTDTTTFELSTLSPATDYYIFVSAMCGEIISDYQLIKVRTENLAAVIPYETDFADASENTQWTILNGSEKNGFIISGANTLFVTNNLANGADAEYAYNSKIESSVYAYRMLNIPSGQFIISYDWKAVGSSVDYGRLFLVPASYTIDAGKRAGYFNEITTEAVLDAVCIPLDGGSRLYDRAMITHYEVPFFVADSGDYKLVAWWYNKGGLYVEELPLWIDNISINRIMCSNVDNLKIENTDHQSMVATFKNYNNSYSVCAVSASNNVDLAFLRDTVTNDTIHFEGLAGNTTYYLFVKSQCYDNVASDWQMITFTTECDPIIVTLENPYIEGFENYSDNDNLGVCWTETYKHDAKTPLYVSSEVKMAYNAFPFQDKKYLTFANGNNVVSASRTFYLEEGTKYVISAWVAASSSSPSTIQLVNFTDKTTLVERAIDYSKYSEVRRVFEPTSTGIYELGFSLNAGISVEHVCVDNFSVEVLRFGMPNQLQVDSISEDYAQISWVGVADYYDMQLYKGEELVLTDTSIIDNSYVLNNLSPATTYKVRLRSIIANPRQESDYVELYFTTDCDVALPTFNQDFEAINTSALPICWDNMIESSLTDYTKNWVVKADVGNKSISVNSADIYGKAVLLSPMIYVNDTQILSYRYRNQSQNDKLKIEIRTIGGTANRDVILEAGYSDWQQQILELSKYKGDTIQLAFIVEVKEATSGNNISIDDVRIANYAGEVIYKDTICAGNDYFGYEFRLSKEEMIVGTQTFTQFVKSTQGDTIKHLELIVNPIAESHLYDTICRGDVYIWGGIPCVETDLYEVWYPNASSCGCDSVAYLHLEVLDLRANIYQTICEGESYKFGNNLYTETGIYVDTIPNPGSCDSVKILTLVVIPSLFETSMTICDEEPFIWNDTVLTTSGRYTRIYENKNGCDSVEVINLTVLPKNTNLSVSICQGSSYLFAGKEIMTTGVYIDSMVNRLGCDSIITLTLTVTEPVRSTFQDYVCEGYEYVGYGFRLNAGAITVDTTLYRTVKTLSGCDSIVELNISFIATAQVDIKATIEQGDFYEFGENSLTKSGNYTETFVSELGCDSIVNLTLEVTTALDDIHLAEITIAPNPIKKGHQTYINHQFTAQEQQNLKVEIINSIGQIISTYNPSTYPIIVGNISQSGIYYIRIKTGTGKQYITKLMIND